MIRISTLVVDWPVTGMRIVPLLPSGTLVESGTKTDVVIVPWSTLFSVWNGSAPRETFEDLLR